MVGNPCLEMRGKNDAESRLSRKSLAGVYLFDNRFILKSPVMMQSLFLMDDKPVICVNHNTPKEATLSHINFFTAI